MSAVFRDRINSELLDSSPFKVRHGLQDHPSLQLETLTETLLRLPPAQVKYSNARLRENDNFEGVFREQRREGSLEAVLRGLVSADSYIMVNSPEVDPAFRELYDELLESVSEIIREKSGNGRVIIPTLYLFIAAPGSITPFHIDRYSTFLFQFRGQKKVFVAQPWDTRVVTDEACERYVSYVNTELPWSEERAGYFTEFNFAPGEALHIPFLSGHYVKNGLEDLSISMSIIFNTEQTMMWRHALNFNLRARKVLGRVNMKPSPVGRHPTTDRTKAGLWKMLNKTRTLYRGAQ